MINISDQEIDGTIFYDIFEEKYYQKKSFLDDDLLKALSDLFWKFNKCKANLTQDTWKPYDFSIISFLKEVNIINYNVIL